MLLLATATTSYAQSEVTDDEVNEVARDLFCPVCESTPLDVCPTQACEDWRELIRVQLAEGRSKEEIETYFASQYGDHVLAEPPRTGFTLLIWIIPFVIVLGGGALFVRYLQQLRGAEQTVRSGSSAAVEVQPAGSPTPQLAPIEAYISQIEAELKQRSQ